MGAARMALNFDPSLEWVGQDDAPIPIDTEAARPPEELVDVNIKEWPVPTPGSAGPARS